MYNWLLVKHFFSSFPLLSSSHLLTFSFSLLSLYFPFHFSFLTPFPVAKSVSFPLPVISPFCTCHPFHSFSLSFLDHLPCPSSEVIWDWLRSQEDGWGHKRAACAKFTGGSLKSQEVLRDQLRSNEFTEVICDQQRSQEVSRGHIRAAEVPWGWRRSHEDG